MNHYEFFIEGWSLSTNLGVTQEERRRKQTLVIDADFRLDTTQQSSPGCFMDYSVLMRYAEELAKAGFPTVENICFCFESAILVWPYTTYANVEVLKQAYKIKVACVYNREEWIRENPECEILMDFIRNGGVFAQKNWEIVCATVLEEYLELVRTNQGKNGNLAPKIPWDKVQEKLQQVS